MHSQIISQFNTLAFLFTTAVSLAAMASFMLWSFDRGFLTYVNAQEQKTLEPLHRALTQHHREQGSWEAFRQGNQLWGQMHRQYLRGLNGAQEFRNRPRVDPARSERRPPPSDERSRPRPRERSGMNLSRRPPPRNDESLPARLTLLDAEKNVVIGRPLVASNDDSYLIPIEDSGVEVGFLGLRPSNELQNLVDVGFIAQQSYRLGFTSLGAIALCLLIAIPIAGQLVRPIKALLSATRELTAGNHAVRTEIFSSDELGQLTRDFNLLGETLASNERDRKQWVSDISHELRTPLAVIRGQTEAMLDGIREPSNKELRLLNTRVLHLGALVDDLYELSLSDQGAMSYHKEAVHLAGNLQEEIDNFLPKMEAQNISLTLSAGNIKDSKVFADQRRLQQLWSNLMTNSLRYTDSPGQIEIEMAIAGKFVSITFNDSAPGVDEGNLPLLFKRLFRVEKSRGRDTGGADLGLSICTDIVRAHGGEIAARASKLGGLSIEVTLPLHTRSAWEKPVTAEASTALSPVLIVEDEPELANLLRDYLQASNFDTKIIHNGLEVIPWVVKYNPRIVLLDLMLPGKDGLEICKEIRAFSNIPVMMITAKVEEIDRLLGLELGADDYICKPFSPREVVARVKAILRRIEPAQTVQCLIEVDNRGLKVLAQGHDTELTVVEFQLFSLLFDEPGRIFSREQIMSGIYNDYRVVSDRTIDSHIKKVRKKLEQFLPDSEVIFSVYGAGYKYEPSA